MRAVLVLLLSGCLFAQTADDVGEEITLTLDSGDVLVGTLVEAADDYVVIEHPLFGTLQVARNRILAPADDTAVVPSAAEEPESPWSGVIDVSLTGNRGTNQNTNFRANLNVRKDDKVTVDAYELTWITQSSEVNVAAPGAPERLGTRKSADRQVGRARREWYVDDTKWRPFGQAIVEVDEFKDYDKRVSLAAGAVYPVIEEEKTTWDVRGGAGASREFGGADESWTPELLFGTDYIVEVFDLNTFGLIWDIFPSLEEQGEYRMITQAKWDVAPAEDSPWRFNVGVQQYYDSDPEAGSRKTDVIYFIGTGRTF